MPERPPSDAVLLSLTHDPATGVEYIPTGRSPYYLDYRRSQQRLLLAAQRANDLRVYDAGGLTVGVRPGRCLIDQQPVAFPGLDAITLPDSAVTDLWIDRDAHIQQSVAGLPADRVTFIPLARVTTDEDSITALTDLRGETFLQSPSPATLGLTASADEINQALDGINPSVTAPALSILTAGDTFPADVMHTHHALNRDSSQTAAFYLNNDSPAPAANVELRFSVPNRFAFPTLLQLNSDHHFLDQTHDQTTLALVGSSNLSVLLPGPLTTSLTDQPLGVVPLDGEIDTVILSLGQPLQTSDPTDRVSATVKVNAVPLTTTPPALEADLGPGFRSTDRDDGTPAQMKTDGTATVRRGDLLTLDLTRQALGTVTQEAVDVGVLVVLHATRPY